MNIDDESLCYCYTHIIFQFVIGRAWIVGITNPQGTLTAAADVSGISNDDYDGKFFLQKITRSNRLFRRFRVAEYLKKQRIKIKKTRLSLLNCATL